MTCRSARCSSGFCRRKVIAWWPLAAVWYSRVKESAWWRWSIRAGFGLPVGATVLLTIHMIEPVPLLPPSIDRATRQQVKLEIARNVAADLRACGYTGPVYTASYQWTATLRWHGVDARQIPGATRPSHFTQRPEPPIDPTRAVVFLEAGSPRRGVVEMEGFGETQSATSYVLQVRGLKHTVCWLVDCSENAIGLGRQPDGRAVPVMARVAEQNPRHH